MNADFFINKVLEPHLKPFIDNVYTDGHHFMQDNNPKHTSNKAKEYYRTASINWWPTPPESPDLNPIEMVWHELNHYIRKTVKPKNKELIKGISTFWGSQMTREKCNKYINHLYKAKTHSN